MAEKLRPTVPRLALSRQESAMAMGMCLRHFERHVEEHLSPTYVGNKKLYAITELQRYIDANTVDHKAKLVAIREAA